MNSPFRIPTKVRIAFSKLGSLLLLFQKTPLVQLLLPEARVLGTSGASEVVKWSVATIAGLGAFDTVAGATVIAQVSPSPNSTTVPAKTGTNLAFLVQVTGAPSAKAGSWQVVGTLPAGLVHANAVNSSTDSITGIPTSIGSYPITIKAWENSGYQGGAKSQAFTIVVTDGGGGSITAPAITGQPASTTLNSGGTTTLTVTASGTTPTFQWYRGASGNTTNPVSGATSASFTTPALTATTSYWARATNSAGSANSNTATITVITPPAFTTQPVSVTIGSGETTTLTAVASGTAPAFQWYRGASGDITNPLSGATAASFTTPALTATTSYWARATNPAGSANSNTATITVITPPGPAGAGPFKVGETVLIDLNALKVAGETLKLVGKLPKGLKLNLATGGITGTVTGLTGTYPVKFSIFQGKTLLRTVDFPIVIAGSAYFAGKYEALLESTGATPAGVFKLLFKKGNTWSATLESPGAKARKASGKLTLAPGSSAGNLAASFAASGSAPAVTLNATLDLESPMVSGTYNGGTVRGFRLADNDELPASSTTLSLVFEAGGHDGIAVPAGLGWANGSIGTPGSATFSGLLGDGTAVNLPIHLSATGQAILWSQPYANPSSFFGGIITLPDLGQTPASDPLLADRVFWFKGPDTKSLSYPAGFPAMEVKVGTSTWTVPATPAALGASLGWLNHDSPVVEIDGAGLSNAAPQLTTPTLPTGFTLDASFRLAAPASPSVVPWTGMVSTGGGTFTGSLALPSNFVPDGVAGAAAASGVLVQAEAWGSVTGCGLIKVPVAGPKGSFRTAAIILIQ